MAGVSHSLWLMPQGAFKLALEQAQRQINASLNGPGFPVHLTVAGGFDVSADALERAVRPILARPKGIVLSPLVVETGDRFFQSVYLRLREDAELIALRREIYGALGVEAPAFLPHVSLYYGEASQAAKLAALSSIETFHGPYQAYDFAIGRHVHASAAIELVKMIQD